jgi:hypothetical protein
MNMFYCDIFTNKHVRISVQYLHSKMNGILYRHPQESMVWYTVEIYQIFIWEYTAAFKETVYPNSVYGDLELPKAWTTHVINFLRPKEKG